MDTRPGFGERVGDAFILDCHPIALDTWVCLLFRTSGLRGPEYIITRLTLEGFRKGDWMQGQYAHTFTRALERYALERNEWGAPPLFEVRFHESI